MAVTGYFLLIFATGAVTGPDPGAIGQLDLRVAKLFFDMRDGAMIRFFTAVTAFGNWGILAMLAGSASVILWLHYRTCYIAGLWLAFIGNQTTVSILKAVFSRTRPEFGVYREFTASFPSGHSAASFAVLAITA